MIIKYKFIESENLLIRRYLIDFNLEQHFYTMTELIGHPSWRNVKKVLTDARGVDPSGVYKNIDAIVSFRREVVQKDYLDVYIIDSPLLTVATYLIQEKLRKHNFDFRYCSTVEQANKLLEIDTIDFNLNRQINHLYCKENKSIKLL